MENEKQELMEQMKRFREEAHKQQQEYQHQLEESIEKVVDILNTVHIQMKSNQKLIEMNQLLDEAQQQFMGVSEVSMEHDQDNGEDERKKDDEKKKQWLED